MGLFPERLLSGSNLLQRVRATNKHLRETYEYCLPHYQVMYQRRLGA